MASGKRFDETFTKGVPIEFELNKPELVDGLREVLQLMPVGAVYRVALPAALGYGLQGNKALGIGPNRRLYYHVELISIVNDRR